jgi:hypothetical protein
MPMRLLKLLPGIAALGFAGKGDQAFALWAGLAVDNTAEA